MQLDLIWWILFMIQFCLRIGIIKRGRSLGHLERWCVLIPSVILKNSRLAKRMRFRCHFMQFLPDCGYCGSEHVAWRKQITAVKGTGGEADKINSFAWMRKKQGSNDALSNTWWASPHFRPLKPLQKHHERIWEKIRSKIVTFVSFSSIEQLDWIRNNIRNNRFHQR